MNGILLIHLSPLLGIIIPFGNILAPLITKYAVSDDALRAEAGLVLRSQLVLLGLTLILSLLVAGGMLIEPLLMYVLAVAFAFVLCGVALLWLIQGVMAGLNGHGADLKWLGRAR